DRHPLQRLSLEPFGLAGVARDEPDVEPHALLGIAMRELEQRRGVLHLDTELLRELAVERFPAAFAPCTLAARELPESRHVRAGPALIDEHAPLGVLEDADEDVHLLVGALVRHRATRAAPVVRGRANRAGRDTACI